MYSQRHKKGALNLPSLKCILLTLFLISFKTALGQEVSFLERSQVTNEGLYFWYPNGKKAFHYAANISPRGDCFTIVNGYIFFGWYKGGMRKRDLMLSRKRIGSGQWVTVQLPHKNTLIGPKVDGWGDSHNTISVGVSKTDGTIHVFYDHHNDPLKYIVSKQNTAFVEDDAFNINIFEPTRGYLAEGQNITITYPKVTENAQGDLIVNYRKGSAVGGNEMVHVYNSKTSTWSRSRMVIRGSGLPQVPVAERNYAYAPSPVLAGGNIYYGFSVRWARKKEEGILNEGVYVANCGPTMTSNWIDVNGQERTLPVQDYSPFLIDDPESLNGKGSSGGPSLAVSDRGDIHISYRSRGRDSQYYYTYVRKAGETEFTKHTGISKTGVAYGNRIYHVSISKSTGTITIQSTEAGTFSYRDDLVYQTNEVLGSSAVRIVDGKLVVIVEDRSNTNTDAQGIFSFVFQIGEDDGNPDPNPTPSPEPETPIITGKWYNLRNVETGRYMDANETALVTAVTFEGVDKEWHFVKTGDYYNIESRKQSGNGRGILRGVGLDNTVRVTNFDAPKADIDKQWTIEETNDGYYRFKLKSSQKYAVNSQENTVVMEDVDGNSGKWNLEEVGVAKQVLSLEEATPILENILAIYPNPATNNFTIALQGNLTGKLIISDMLGKQVYKAPIKTPKITLETGSIIKQGIYIVSIITPKGQAYYKKLVIR